MDLIVVSKFYAVAKTKDGRKQVVNAFEALKLADDDPWNYPVDKAKGVFYDLETGLKVSPSRGRTSRKTHRRGQPFFRYFTGEPSPLKDQEGSFTYSPELIAFLSAFETIQIQEDATSIMIFPEQIVKLQRVTFPDDGGYSILKFYMKLEVTYPYSAYYKLNGILAIEFYVSGKPSRLKRAELARKGIPLFEAKAFFPKWIQESLPEEFDKPQKLVKIAKEIRATYQDRNYKLLGRFRKTHRITPDNERKYQILKSFEDQCEELQTQIKELEACFSQKSDKISQLREEIKQAEGLLQYYCEKEEYYKKMERDNQRLNIELNRLEAENVQLSSEKSAVQEENKALRSRSILQRLFNK